MVISVELLRVLAMLCSLNTGAVATKLQIELQRDCQREILKCAMPLNGVDATERFAQCVAK